MSQLSTEFLLQGYESNFIAASAASEWLPFAAFALTGAVSGKVAPWEPAPRRHSQFSPKLLTRAACAASFLQSPHTRNTT